MNEYNDFSEISVLIPGYSIEDISTDLSETDAASLLNAVACAWHPGLFLKSSGIPIFRQAESLAGYPGRRIIFVPASAESWMPHEWRATLTDQGHVVIAGCSSRQEWLDAVELCLRSSESDGSGSDDYGDPVMAELTPHFLALGTVLLQVSLLSRRRHHFVDPDQMLLGREVRHAAEAAQKGDRLEARRHLRNCFEHLREIRERFYPMNCCLLDICIPSDEEDAQVIVRLLQGTADPTTVAPVPGEQASRERVPGERESGERENPDASECVRSDGHRPDDEQREGGEQPDEDSRGENEACPDVSTHPINLLVSGMDLVRWCDTHPELSEVLRRRVQDGSLCLMSGHEWETRSSLGSMLSLVSDLDLCRATFQKYTGALPRHWARRRFGLTASLPAVLSYYGFESAFHVALDDGLYPDREKSQFEWQSPDGTVIAASSRIPLAVDSASGFLRLADRFNESMHDDTPAALFFARLPTLRSPWLSDLLTASSYAPVLGEFCTVESLCAAASGSRLAERHQHADYMAPCLIQSAVLRTEPPVTGPAALRILWQRVQSLNVIHAIAALMKVTDADRYSGFVESLIRELAELELAHVDVLNKDGNRTEQLQHQAEQIRTHLSEMELSLSEAIQARVPSQSSGARGLFLINGLPFGRLVEIPWPHGWKSPAQSSVIELLQRDDSGERMLVRMPPGGFAWITEHDAAGSSQDAIRPVRGEPQLAEAMTLRNRHFEVKISDRTGGIESVLWHNRRGNRLSQQSCYRYEREQTLSASESGEVRKSAYAVVALRSQKVTESGLVFVAIETVSDLLSPADGTFLGTVYQTTSVDRVRPQLRIALRFEDLRVTVKGNPWLTYFGCRFAWEDETAMISRSVLGQAAGFRAERFESPDYFEVSNDACRMTVCAHGRPYHRRSGPRMIDSLLITEAEPAREFRFTIDFDQPCSLRTAADAMTPVIVRETSGATPVSVSSAWILGITAKNVEVVRCTQSAASEDSSEELELLLQETEGIDATCSIRTARQPKAAFQINADRTEKFALEINDQGVPVTIRAFQIRGVLLIF